MSSLKKQAAIHKVQAQAHAQLDRSAAEIFAANVRINQMLVAHIDPTVWSAKAPGNVRSIAAIFTHMHNVRRKWVRLSAPYLKVPPQLNRSQSTPQQAAAGLAESAACCAEMLTDALPGAGRVAQFRRDSWSRPWPAGTEMLCYMLAHETHHCGQVCMLMHQFGFRLPDEIASGMWSWERLWSSRGSRSSGPP